MRTFRHRGLKRLYERDPIKVRADQAISGNWRVVFRFADGDAFDIDLVDYH